MKKHLFLIPSKARGFVRLVPVISLLFCLSCSTSTEVQYSFWEGTLVPLGTNLVTGTSAAVTQFGRTEVSVEMRQGEGEADYGWYLQSADCQTDGNILGGVANYPLMTTDESGVATATALLSYLLYSGRSYSVRVYVPMEGGGEELLACADLQETTGE